MLDILFIIISFMFYGFFFEGIIFVFAYMIKTSKPGCSCLGCKMKDSCPCSEK